MPTVTTIVRSALWLSVTVLAAHAAPAEALQCADKPVVGAGPGFYPSPGQAEDVAKDAWLAGAHAVFADATWETAKNPDIVCAIQGLFHNCTATAIPCGTAPGTPAGAASPTSPAAPPANQ